MIAVLRNRLWLDRWEFTAALHGVVESSVQSSDCCTTNPNLRKDCGPGISRLSARYFVSKSRNVRQMKHKKLNGQGSTNSCIPTCRIRLTDSTIPVSASHIGFRSGPYPSNKARRSKESQTLDGRTVHSCRYSTSSRVRLLAIVVKHWLWNPVAISIASNASPVPPLCRPLRYQDPWCFKLSPKVV